MTITVSDRQIRQWANKSVQLGSKNEVASDVLDEIRAFVDARRTDTKPTRGEFDIEQTIHINRIVQRVLAYTSDDSSWWDCAQNDDGD